MNNKTIGFAILVLLLIFTSCNKYVGDYNEDFVGYWKSSIVTDNISGAQQQSYMIIDGKKSEFGLTCNPSCGLSCDCVRLVNGRAIVNSSKTKLRIGYSRNSLTLTIDQEPIKDSNGDWTCKLNGTIFYKQ